MHIKKHDKVKNYKVEVDIKLESINLGSSIQIYTKKKKRLKKNIELVSTCEIYISNKTLYRIPQKC